MSEAALAFLDSIDGEQRKAAQWPFPAEEERLRWYYTPTDHGGLALGDMRPKQQQHALKVLATGLSRPAYVTACTIIGLDNVLDELEGWSATWERERGRDPGLFYLRIFGEPGGRDPWSWRFGGHHISIHHLVVDGAVRASTPLFLGADPAVSPFLGGYELRPLGSAEDLGRELLISLDDDKRVPAVISPVPPFDLVGANRARVRGGELPLKLPEVWRGRFDGDLGELVETVQRQLEEGLQITDEHLEALRLTSTPKGISAEAMNGQQRRLLRDIIAVYVGRLPDDLADAELVTYTEEHMKKLSFAWAGGAVRGVPHYYRIQGPRLLIEYDNAQRGGNHAHSVWRDPDGDFGTDILNEHHLEG
ncbi:MAG: DUF3500 domain-containing protein [Actinobacteria bacterium]|nr:DUF3500 domain-containing protein [Actinomycetota bacterium]